MFLKKYIKKFFYIICNSLKEERDRERKYLIFFCTWLNNINITVFLVSEEKSGIRKEKKTKLRMMFVFLQPNHEMTCYINTGILINWWEYHNRTTCSISTKKKKSHKWTEQPHQFKILALNSSRLSKSSQAPLVPMLCLWPIE